MNDDNIFSKEFDSKLDDIFDKILDESEKNFTPENIENKMYCSNLLVNYLRRIGRSPEEDYSDVVPISFDLLGNDTKIRILEECLNENTTIENSRIYNSSIEGNFDINDNQDTDIVK